MEEKFIAAWESNRAAAGLMGIMLKGEKDKLTIQFKGDGPAQEILATGLANGVVKGYIANPDVDLPLNAQGKLDVGGSLGIGTLTVIKNLGLKEPYVGRIDLVNGEIAEDLTAYFFVSEQQSSSVALGVRVDTDLSVAAAGGMIIQMLPGADMASVDALVLPMTAEPGPAIALAQALRAEGLKVQLYGEQKKFKQKMAYANKLGVPFAVLLGEDEIAENVCSVKNMITGEQVKLSPVEAAAHIKAALQNNGPIILEG